MAKGFQSEVKEFGKLVRKRRETLGWSQEALAAEAFSNSMRKGYVSQIENGKIPNITGETVKNIARALKLGPENIPSVLRWPEAIESSLLEADNSVTTLAKDVEALKRELLPPFKIVAGYELLEIEQIARLPTAMIVADYGLVPYLDIGGTLQCTMEWILGASPNSVAGRLLSAPGGYGKTRLALELVDKLNDTDDWIAGLIPASSFESRGANDQYDINSAIKRFVEERGQRGLFLVIDYAERRATQIELLSRLAIESSGGPVRILLLARNAGDWWKGLKNQSRALQLVFGQDEANELTASFSNGERETLFNAAYTIFSTNLLEAQSFDKALSVDHDNNASQIDIERIVDQGETPLEVLILAYLRARGIETTDSPIIEIAREERSHWARALRLDAKHLESLSDPRMDVCHRISAVITLVQGAESGQYYKIEDILDLAVQVALENDPHQGPPDASTVKMYADARIAIEGLYRANSSHGDRLLPVLPDLLGEYVIAQALKQSVNILRDTAIQIPKKCVQAITVVQSAIDGINPESAKRFAPALGQLMAGDLTERHAVALCNSSLISQGSFYEAVLSGIPVIAEKNLTLFSGVPQLSYPRMARMQSAISKRYLKARTEGANNDQRQDRLEEVRRFAHAANSLFGEGRITEAIQLNGIAQEALSKHVGAKDEAFHLAEASLIANEAVILSGKGRHEEAIEKIEQAKIRILPYHSDSEETVKFVIKQMINSSAIYRRADRSSEALLMSGEAAKVCEEMWSSGTNAGLSIEDLELITGSFLNLANALSDAEETNAINYYELAWDVVDRSNEIAPTPRHLEVAAVYANYLFNKMDDPFSAKQVFMQAAKAKAVLFKSNKSEHADDFFKLIRSIVTCMKKIGDSGDEITNLLKEFGLEEGGTEVGYSAQLLFSNFVDAHNANHSIPVLRNSGSAALARRQLEDYLNQHKDDATVQEIEAELKEIDRRFAALDEIPEYVHFVSTCQKFLEKFLSFKEAADLVEVELYLDEAESLSVEYEHIEELAGPRNFLATQAERFREMLLKYSLPKGERQSVTLSQTLDEIASLESLIGPPSRDRLLKMGLLRLRAAEIQVEEELPEAEGSLEEAMRCFQSLLTDGPLEIKVHIAKTLDALAAFLLKQGQAGDAEETYRYAVEAICSLPSSIRDANVDLLRSASHGYMRSAKKAGKSDEEIHSQLGRLGVIAVDPADAPKAIHVFNHWVNEHNEENWSEAERLYAELVQALDEAIDNAYLDEIRNILHTKLTELRHRYGALPKLREP